MTQLQSKDDVRQLQLDITPTDEEMPTQPFAQVSPLMQILPARHKHTGYISGIALVTGVFLVLVLVWQAQDKPAPERPVNFSASALSPAPEITRTFHDIPFFDSGEILQLGLYRKLGGAETQQAELARLGLLAHIEKRVADTEVKYAVMIGPLNPEAHERTIAKLTANQVTYFHARGASPQWVKSQNESAAKPQGT